MNIGVNTCRQMEKREQVRKVDLEELNGDEERRWGRAREEIGRGG
jgi:hypothetical protein